MKRIVSVTAVFLCGISLLQAQPVRVSETLKELDMENISVVEKRDTITAAFETSAYRGIYNGIGIAIRHLVTIPEIPTLLYSSNKPIFTWTPKNCKKQRK